jgi:hypothetical protein
MVTVSALIFPSSPLTAIVEGYGVAAPTVGIVIAVVLLNVAVAAWAACGAGTTSAANKPASRHTTLSRRPRVDVRVEVCRSIQLLLTATGPDSQREGECPPEIGRLGSGEDQRAPRESNLDADYAVIFRAAT